MGGQPFKQLSTQGNNQRLRRNPVLPTL